MGKYDAIRGAGNVTVNAPPDFWTSAKQSFDDDYDRLVEAQERKKEEERYNSETAKEVQRYSEQTSTERRRYLEQQEQIKKAQDRQDWQYMYEGAKTDSQRAMIYKNGLNNKVSGLTASGLDAINEASMTETSLNTASQNYYAGDDLYRHENGAKLIADLIRNNKHSEASLIEQNMKESRKNVENKETFDMVVSQYPSVFSDDLKGLFTSVGDMSDTQLNMASTILDNNLKKSLADSKQKRDFYESLIKIGANAEFPNEISRNAAQLGFLGIQSLDAGDAGTTETKQLPYPTLESIDETTTGLKNTFDTLSDSDKSKEFKSTLKEIIPGGEEAWKKMENDERAERGKKIIETINKKSYITGAKLAGLSGIQYGDPKGAIVITEDMITEKANSLMDTPKYSIPEKSKNDPDIIAQMRNIAKKELEKELKKESRKRTSTISEETFPEYQKLYRGKKGRQI